MYVSLLASLISLLQDCHIYSHKMPWCAFVTAVKNYNFEKLQDFSSRPRPNVQDQDQCDDALLNR